MDLKAAKMSVNFRRPCESVVHYYYVLGDCQIKANLIEINITIRNGGCIYVKMDIVTFDPFNNGSMH